MTFKEYTKDCLNVMALMTFVALIIAGIFEVVRFGKSLTYKGYYPDRVQQTVREMVKDSALR